MMKKDELSQYLFGHLFGYLFLISIYSVFFFFFLSYFKIFISSPALFIVFFLFQEPTSCKKQGNDFQIMRAEGHFMLFFFLNGL